MKLSAKIDDDRLREIWFDLDVPVRDIAQRFGCTREAVYTRAKKLGLPSRSEVRGQAIDEDRLRELWREPLTIEQIARRLGATPGGVLYAGRRLGLPPRPHGARKKAAEREAKIRRLWLAEVPSGEIAEVVGVSRPSVTRIAKRLGLPRRNQKGQIVGRMVDAEPRPVPPAPSSGGGEAAPDPMPADRPPGPWTVDQDARILATGGKYEKVARLAREWDRPSARIIARFHALARRQ